jgi:tetratricopeptide (TPR) repeat protein
MRRNHCIGIALGALLLAPLPASLLAQNDTGVTGKINEQVIAARVATKDKRYADAEALMLPVTAEKPDLLVPRLELGFAQLGEKKYAEAESTFKIVLGTDPASQKLAHSDDFYQKGPGPEGEATHNTRNTAGSTALATQNRTPEIKGVAYSSLGEIYIRTNRIPEAQEAFDTAVKSNPSQAALYLRNETTFFFQTGNSDGQLAAAEKAIAVDPTRAILYYFKAQALTSKATVDPKTQKMVLPPGCAEAYQKYLQIEPNGQFAPDTRSLLAAAGIPASGKTAKN